jgi:hypothetical protein
MAKPGAKAPPLSGEVPTAQWTHRMKPGRGRADRVVGKCKSNGRVVRIFRIHRRVSTTKAYKPIIAAASVSFANVRRGSRGIDLANNGRMNIVGRRRWWRGAAKIMAAERERHEHRVQQ